LLDKLALLSLPPAILDRCWRESPHSHAAMAAQEDARLFKGARASKRILLVAALVVLMGANSAVCPDEDVRRYHRGGAQSNNAVLIPPISAHLDGTPPMRVVPPYLWDHANVTGLSQQLTPILHLFHGGLDDNLMESHKQTPLPQTIPACSSLAQQSLFLLSTTTEGGGGLWPAPPGYTF